MEIYCIRKKIYNQKQISYVVQVPALFTGKRSNGQDYERAGWFPLDNPFKIKASVSQANRDLFIKQGVNATYPDGILAEFSEERITIRRNGQWKISEMVTTPANPGEINPETSITDRPLGTKPRIYAMLPFPEYIAKTAFEETEHFMCVPSQIAEITKQDTITIADRFDACGDWRNKGITPKRIFAYCQKI